MTKAKGKSTTTGASKAKGQKSSSTDRSAKNDQLNSIIIYGCLVIVLLFVFFIRLRLIDFPLERDEGEYALMGQLILKGIPPYEMAYNMKLPGVYYMYALIMSIFGQTPTGIHLGLLLVNLSSTFLLFIIGKKLGNGFLGVFAAGTFGLLSLSPSHLGFAAHATQFIVAFGLAGFLTLIYYIERPRLWMLVLSGFCFGLAFIMKQQAIFLLLFGLIVFGIDQWQRKPFQPVKSILRGALYGTSMTVPYLLVVLIAVMTGSFDQFWHWTMEYAREYAGIKTMGEAVTNFTSTISNVSEGMQLAPPMDHIPVCSVIFCVCCTRLLFQKALLHCLSSRVRLIGRGHPYIYQRATGKKQGCLVISIACCVVCHDVWQQPEQT